MSLNNSKPDHLKKISLEQIQLATNNFSDDNVIGRGGFGLVYKGQLCPSTKLVAIKRLDEKLGGQGQVLCGRLGVIYKYKADDDRRFLSQLARRHYKDGTLEDIINQDLRKQIKPKSLRAFSRIAYQCLKKDRKRRPTMELVIEELQNSLEFQISCQRITRIGLWGSSTCGNPWSFPLDDNQKLRQIRIDHKNWIYSLAFTTQDSNGLLHHSQHYGGEHGDTGGRISEVNFDADEQIVGIVGTVGITYGWPLTTGWVKGLTVISSLSFVTNKKTDGPFGNEAGGVRFSVPWDAGSFAGFYGRAGLYMDGLGFYLKSVTLLE
uniref:mannose/glucose-specific lectin-like isoform X2 n=1 Tax=Erigeron canadensis TaxID=72917 RepID=UPI001CB9764C|nr:mannose/glucose-specific lectin-like isoform X2 [Erigeron canadensis]